jgi:hypothetical protein
MPGSRQQIFLLYALREGGHAPRLRSRPERASDMHPQAPNTQTFLPACLLPTACDYNGLDCFDPLVPPSAPERTLQASGQGQAIARPQGRPTLLLRACTIYALGGEWREPAAEDKLCVPVPRQAHTRTRAYVCNLMRSPGEEILRKAGCRRERTIKRLQMEASIIAHAWLTPANFSCCTRIPPLRISLSDQE